MQICEITLFIEDQPQRSQLRAAAWESETDDLTMSLVLKMTPFLVSGHLDPEKILNLIPKEDLFPQMCCITLFCFSVSIF